MVLWQEELEAGLQLCLLLMSVYPYFEVGLVGTNEHFGVEKGVGRQGVYISVEQSCGDS